MPKFVERYAPYSLPVLLILGGLVCLGITSSSNADLAMSYASSKSLEWRLASGAVAIDIILVAIFPIVAGIFYRQGRYLSVVGLSVFIALGVAFSALSFYQFGIKERVSKTDVAERQYQADVKAIQDTQARKDAMLNRLMDDLQADAERADGILYSKGGKVDRDAAVARADDARKKKAELGFGEVVAVAAAPVYVAPDPGAAELAKDTGFSTAAIQKFFTATLVVIIVLLKPLCFGLGTALLPAKTASTEVTTHAEPEIIPRGPKLIVDANTQVLEFYHEATREAPGADPIIATKLHKLYLAWVEEKNYHPVLTGMAFGRASTHVITNNLVNVKRRNTSKGIEYVGRAPVKYIEARVA